MIYTLFSYPSHQAFSDDVDDATLSKWMAQFPEVGARLNILFKREDEVALNNGATKAIVPPNIASGQWLYMIFQVIGQMTLSLTGVDSDGTTAITSTIPFYGTSYYPDMGIVSTFGVTALTLNSLADGSSARYFVGLSCDDADSRLTTYA